MKMNRTHNGKRRNDRQSVRRIDAEGRQEEWDKLTPQQQLSALDGRLGKGVGAEKQRARIAKTITKAKVKS
jgi:hypothetical protein